MEDAEAEQLLGVDVDEQLGDPTRLDAGGQKPSVVGDLDALHELHDEQALRAQLLDYVGDDDVISMGEGVLQVRDGPGLPAKV